MATFRTDPDTGRTVISSDNIVRDDGMTDRERGMTAGQRVDNRISGGDPRGGYEGMNAPTLPGTGYMSRSEFEAVSGMTDTNPYGNDGFFSRVFGIDPSKIDYTSNLGPRGIENVKRQAYDRFMNPFARVDAFGRPTMGADPVAGTTRSGVQPGDLTVFGPAIESRQDGIAGLFQNTMLGAMMPKRARITGYDTNVLLPDLMEGPAVGGGTEPPGVSYFTSSTNPPLAPDAPSLEDIKAARDAGERSFGEVDFDTERRATDEDSPVSRGTVPESTYRPIFTDDIPTVAEIIAAEPMVTERPSAAVPGYVNPVIDPETGLVVEGGTRLPTGPKVVQAIPGGDPGSASITVRPGSTTPTYDTTGDGPIDLITPELLPGMDDILNAPPLPQVDRRTGRIPGTSGTFDFEGGTSANVTTFSPQDVARMNKRAQDIDALRFQYIQQGMPPALAFARARAQVGQ